MTKRTNSGNSETTSSGCESARSSEIGDEEETDEQKSPNYVRQEAISTNNPRQQNGDYSQFALPHTVGNGAPMGYSKVGDRNISLRQMPQPQNQSNYVTFNSAVQRPQQLTTVPASNAGYISIAQANKMNAVSPNVTPAIPDLTSPVDSAIPGKIGYSKVGVQHEPVNSLGYVPPSFLQQNGNANTSSSQMSDMALMADHQRNQLTSPVSDFNLKQLSPSSPVPDSQNENSYIQVQLDHLRMHHQHQLEDPTLDESDSQKQNNSLLMSPKTLQVEARDPYSAVTTTLQHCKSSMV